MWTSNCHFSHVRLIFPVCSAFTRLPLKPGPRTEDRGGPAALICPFPTLLPWKATRRSRLTYFYKSAFLLAILDCSNCDRGLRGVTSCCFTAGSLVRIRPSLARTPCSHRSPSLPSRSRLQGQHRIVVGEHWGHTHRVQRWRGLRSVSARKVLLWSGLGSKGLLFPK